MGWQPGVKHSKHKKSPEHGNSKLKVEFYEQAIAMGKEGKSPAQMAAKFGVARNTLNKWIDSDPKFAEAFAIAMTHCQAWWEDQGQAGMFLDKFNAAVWKKSVECRFRDDYTERQEMKHEGGFVLQFDPEDKDA